jgi:hypothetical protein
MRHAATEMEGHSQWIGPGTCRDGELGIVSGPRFPAATTSPMSPPRRGPTSAAAYADALHSRKGNRSVANVIVPFLVALAAAGAFVRHAQASPAMPVTGAERKGAHVQRLADDQARAIAIRFAPRFRFHPDEAYLPVHPLFVLDTADQMRSQGTAAINLLGSPTDRIRRYRALTLAEKAAKARIFYDVYHD